MKKNYLNSFCARYLSLLVLALLSTNLAWGADKTSTLTFTAACKGSGTADDGVTWTVTSDAKESTYDGTKGIHYGTNKLVVSYLTLTTSDINKTITKIVVNASGASKTTATISATVGNVAFGTQEQSITSSATDYTFTGSASGTITISLNQENVAKALYVKSIEITYDDGQGDDPILQSIAISGTPDKKEYKSNEAFDPTGLMVTGTYEGGSEEEITSGIEWTVTPSGNLPVGTTSVSVTAKVGEVTSDQYEVTGLTVTKFVQTYANNYTSNVTLSTEGGTSASAAKVVIDGTEYDAIKCGTGSVSGKCVVTIPANTKVLHFHAAGWNGETVVLNENFELVADAGVSNSTPFILKNDPETKDYFTLDPKGATTITFTATTGKRFVLFGVNAEASTNPTIEADVEAIEFEQKELSGTVTDSKTISATGKNLTAAISASMKEGSDAVFSVTPVGTSTVNAGEFTVSYSATEAGEYSGTVVLSSGETTLEIPVSASVVAHIPVLQSIAVSGTPDKMEYTEGEAFETAGLVVTGTYDVGDPQVITEGIEWAVNPETFETAGTVSVDVLASVGSITSEVYTVNDITVNEAPKVINNWNTLFGTSYDGQISGLQGTNDLVLQGTTAFGVTVKVENHASKNGYIKDQDLRMYTNTDGDYTFTVTAPEGKIFKQIVATKGGKTIAVEEQDGKGSINVDATSGDMTWTGKANSLVFVPTATMSFGTMSFVIAEPTPSAETPTITPSAEVETYWEPITITLASTTEGATIYYTTDGTDPTTASTLYENPFEVSATTTIKAIAVKEGLDNSEVATKEFTFGHIFTSLEDLAAADLTSGTTVKVSFENVPIKSIFVTQQGYRNGIYFDIQKDGKDIEIYYQNVPEKWVAGGKVSGTMICPWKSYQGTWELSPASNSWNWSNLTYAAPESTTVTIASSGYSSFSSTYAVTIPEDVTAYYATGVEGNKVSMIEVEGGIIPANEGVIIKGVASQEYTFIETVSDKTFYNNKLVAVSEKIESLAPEVTTDNVVYKNYVFTGGQFHPFTNGATVSVGAGKAYLQVEKPSDTNAKLEMNFGDLTGIESLAPALSERKGVYNLNGMRVNPSTGSGQAYKGIVIMNGKKYINN